MLQQKKIRFNESNPAVEDVCGLANDDYAFFSLEIGPQLAKQNSRFGNIIFKVPFSPSAFHNASLSLVDQLILEYPEPKIRGLSQQGKKELSERETLKNTGTFFHGREASIASLARHIVIATRCLSGEADRNLILNERIRKILATS